MTSRSSQPRKEGDGEKEQVKKKKKESPHAARSHYNSPSGQSYFCERDITLISPPSMDQLGMSGYHATTIEIVERIGTECCDTFLTLDCRLVAFPVHSSVSLYLSRTLFFHPRMCRMFNPLNNPKSSSSLQSTSVIGPPAKASTKTTKGIVGTLRQSHRRLIVLSY